MSTSRNLRRLRHGKRRGDDSTLPPQHAALLASKRKLERQHLAIQRKLKFLCLASEEAKDYSVQFDIDYRAAWTETEWREWLANKLKGRRSE